MVELIVPLLFGLVILLSALSRMRRELYGSGMMFLAGGLVLLLQGGLDVSGRANTGIRVGWISQPTVCVRGTGLRC